MRTRISVAAALLLASAGACAQSTVTLYGTLDEGLNFTNNARGNSAYQITGSDVATSRWGVKGSEDLGGGLHAVFDLSSAFALESGQLTYGGRLFGYQSYVGLESDKLGSLTIGRQYDSISDTVGMLAATGNWAGYLFAHPIDNDDLDGTYHASNSVKFTSNTYGGFSGTALYGFSNQARGFAQNRIFTAGLNYTYSTLTVAAAYADLSSPGTTANGAVASDDMGFVAANQKTYAVGANYGIGNATLGAVYTHVALEQPSASIYLGDLPLSSLHFDNAEFNVRYNVTPELMLGGMYTYTRAMVDQGGNDSSLHWNQLGLMAQYSLSKRTQLYTQVVYQKVSGTSGTPLDFAYIPGSADLSSNSHQIAARIAILHSF